MPRLDVVKVVYGAFALPWEQRKNFFNALFIPTSLLFTYSLCRSYLDEWLPEGSVWPLTLLFAVLFTFFAVPCHRLALLGSEQKGAYLPRWSRRETRFLVWLTLLWGSMMLGLMASTMVADTLALNLIGPEGWETLRSNRVVWYASLLPAYYLIARFSLMLPAIAIDNKTSPVHAWYLSRNNGLRLMLIVYAVPWTLGWVVDNAYRDDSSSIEIGILILLEYLTFAIQICAISLAYRELSRAG